MLLYKRSRGKVARSEDSLFQIQEKNKRCWLFENLMYTPTTLMMSHGVSPKCIKENLWQVFHCVLKNYSTKAFKMLYTWAHTQICMDLNNIGIAVVVVAVIIITLSTLGILNFNRNMNAEMVYQHFRVVNSICRAEAPLYFLTWVVSGMLMVLHW